jgi:hypothetical protein
LERQEAAMTSILLGALGFFLIPAVVARFSLRARSRDDRLVWLSLSILMSIGIAAIALIEVRNELLRQRFGSQDLIAEYLAAYPSAQETTPLGGGLKFVAIAVESRTIDIDVMAQMPSSHRASSPAEVDAVMRISRRTTTTSTYTDGSKGFGVECVVEVLDLKRRLIVAKRILAELPTPAKRKGTGDAYGVVDAQEIVRSVLR